MQGMLVELSIFNGRVIANVLTKVMQLSLPEVTPPTDHRNVNHAVLSSESNLSRLRRNNRLSGLADTSGSPVSRTEDLVW